MRGRCYNPKNTSYLYYGAKGVTVCKEWLDSFEAFYEWAITNGWKKGLCLDKDKLAPNGVGMCYCPEYCTFITQAENNRYKTSKTMLEYKGETKSLMAWCVELELDETKVRNRVKAGWTATEAFETPDMSPSLVLYKGRKKTVRQWCLSLNLEYATVYARIKNLKWSIEKSLSTPAYDRGNNKHPLKTANT